MRVDATLYFSARRKRVGRSISRSELLATRSNFTPTARPFHCRALDGKAGCWVNPTRDGGEDHSQSDIGGRRAIRVFPRRLVQAFMASSGLAISLLFSSSPTPTS